MTTSFAIEDIILINRLRDQEAILSSKSEEIKKILSNIPESKYNTNPNTAIKATNSNNNYNNTNSSIRYNKSNVNNNYIPMTPYSYIDRISINTNVSTIKLNRNINSYNKSNQSYNPNMMDILTIKERLDNNNGYDTLQQVLLYV